MKIVLFLLMGFLFFGCAKRITWDATIPKLCEKTEFRKDCPISEIERHGAEIFRKVCEMAEINKGCHNPEIEHHNEQISHGQFLGAMKKYLKEFKRCNRKQKEIDSSIKYKFVMRYELGNCGKIVGVALSSPPHFEGSYITNCIFEASKYVEFPAFRGPKKTVSFPFAVK